MKNNEALKKHHFWILFGLVPLFVLIAVLMISSSVGGEVERRNKAIEEEKSKLSRLSSPKSAGLLGVMDEMIKKVDGKRGGLWKENWDRQKDLFVWPQSPLFTGFVRKAKGPDGKDVETPVKLTELKFGEYISNNVDQYQEFKKPEFYRALFSTAGLADRVPPGTVGMADSIAPTQFNGGWERILRHVNDWGQKALVSDQIWLVMEDVWVQRSLLQAIKSVNDEMSAFQRIKYEDAKGTPIDDPAGQAGSPQDPLRRKFRSRTWEVALEVKTRGNRQYLTGTLENITDRLQVLGIGKNLTLKVWLEKNQDGGLEGIEPFEFRIGSDFLPGKGGTKRIRDKSGKDIEVPSNIAVTQPDESNDKEFDKYPNIIPAGKTVQEIVKVEQVFDSQTVPIRRIEAMALGYTDSRYAAMGTLLPPPSPPFAKVESAAATTATTPGTGGDTGSSAGGPPPGLGGGMIPGGSGSTTTAIRAGGGALTSVIDANKNRYVERTPQVRRMPVGIVVVVDQTYIQDVLLAYANSPLRFQITQVTWHRFRDKLGTGSAGESGGPEGGGVLMGQPGSFGQGFSSGGDPDMGPLGRLTTPPGGGSALGPPGGGGSRKPGLSAPGLGGGMGMGMGGGSDPFGPGGGSMTTVSEAQLTSGLVELSIYGIVSLYERYNAEVDAASAAKEGEPKETTPAKDDPKDKEPKDKEPKDPMPAAPANPKMRVRRRVAR